MNYRMGAEARAEFRAATAWYHDQHETFGQQFADAVLKLCDAVCQLPEIYPQITAHLRKAKLQGFPYLIVYEICDTEILIHAIVHERRRPFFWHQRTEH